VPAVAPTVAEAIAVPGVSSVILSKAMES
jgi:hypothetical protein